MMPIKQYVAEQLHLLVNDFPNIKVQCHFDAFDGTICVKILPVIDYWTNIDLINSSADLLINLLHHYPNESLAYYTEGSTINVCQFDYTLTGTDFVPEMLPAKKQKIEVVVPKRKRRDPLHDYVSRVD